MIFKLYHPNFLQYTIDVLQADFDIEDKINRLGPVKLVSGAYDWPTRYFGFRGWTDKLNSLWWPEGADNFSTCVLLIHDTQNDVLSQVVEAQKSSLQCWHWPYLILSARLQGPIGPIDGQPGQYLYPPESYPPSNVPTVTQETILMEWLMYPLQPINLSSLNLSTTESYRGWWLLPLVDKRYFERNVPLNQWSTGSSSSSCGTEPGYPIIEIDNTQTPTWMPPVLSYPLDINAPANFTPIAQNGTWPGINGSMRWGEAADLQARMENWRVVNRDVRSNFSIPGGGGTPHKDFTGVISDYPEDWSNVAIKSYHVDAINFLTQSQNRSGGGLCDVRSLDELTARKLQVLFRVTGTDAFYSVTIAAKADFPSTVADLIEDVDGPSPDEAKIIPMVNLGVPCSSRSPQQAEHDQLVVAAKQWALLYYLWRQKQTYMVFPGICPVIPNGHAKVIRWDFYGDTRYWRTTYIALEGVQGTDQSYCVNRQPFYAVIDGEGSLQDNLHGFYAFTELLDKGGVLTTHPNPRRGFVMNVNGSTQTLDPARDENGKVAVPVGMTVWLKPGVPYLDMTTGKIFNHYLFTTSDLLQVVRLKPVLEVNEFGHLGAIIQRWNPDLKAFVDSKDIWVVILD